MFVNVKLYMKIIVNTNKYCITGIPFTNHGLRISDTIRIVINVQIVNVSITE